MNLFNHISTFLFTVYVWLVTPFKWVWQKIIQWRPSLDNTSLTQGCTRLVRNLLQCLNWSPLRRAGLAGAVSLIVIMLELCQHAQAQAYQLNPQQPNFYRVDTNAGIFPLTLTNGGAANWVYTANGSISGLNQPTNAPYVLTLRQDKGLAVFVTVISSNSQGGLATIGFDVTPDRVTETTTQPLKFAVPTANYSNNLALTSGILTTNTYWTNWPAAVLSNLRTIQATTVTNALIGGGPTTNSVNIQLRYSYSGT